ncbi:helix-turn-helix transcriptional regulator [Saccharopolyspora hirsuta]|uniref:helix-turn-helix transcriptional regulator n=1 Tax=Saccharopolyspora hirsuta TaxID=1837 RepID=UPI003319E5B5
MLDVLAADSDQGRVYRALTTRGQLPRELLVRDTGLPAEVVTRALAELSELDLVVEVGKGTDLWEAAPPERAVSAALRAEETRRRELWRAGAELDRLYHQAQRGAGFSRHVEPVEHPARLIMLTTRLQERAAEQVRWLDRPPYSSTPHHFRAQEEVQARRMSAGVRYRTVYSQDVYDDPGLFAAMTRMAELGEHVRLLSELPVKLTIGDDEMALLVPEPDRTGLEGALVVHASGLLNALCGLFETLWTLALPVSVEREQDQLSDRDRAIITLMAAGATDEAIARRLDLSRRTVVRRIAALLDQLGATTRFQAGVQAAKRGLL